MIFILIFFATLAIVKPDLFVWFRGPWITYSLSLVMLAMGISTSAKDYSIVLKSPGLIFLGLLLQFTVMPLLGFGLAKLLGLPTSLAVGLILVASCPGGTASNIVCYLAKAHVPLSVVLTTFSTFLAVFVTPFWTKILSGSWIDLNPWPLVWTTSQIVLLPVALGVFFQSQFPKAVKKLEPVASPFATLLVAMIVASILAENQSGLVNLKLFTAVFLLHSLGFLFGFATRIFFPPKVAVAISIEVGMQNSGLGAVLSKQHFPDPTTALPSALSSITHSALGFLIAWICRWKKIGDGD